jgi:hypothetical protein
MRWFLSAFFLTGVSLAAAFFLQAANGPARLVTPTVPTAFSFSTPLRLVRPDIPASPGVTLLDQDIEPEIKSDIFGNIYVTAIDGVPGGVDLWKSIDKGASFVYLGHPDGAQDRCGAPPLPTCVGGAGGGDDSIDVSEGGYLYVSSLSLASVTVSTSMDGGTGHGFHFIGWRHRWRATGPGLDSESGNNRYPGRRSAMAGRVRRANRLHDLPSGAGHRTPFVHEIGRCGKDMVGAAIAHECG